MKNLIEKALDVAIGYHEYNDMVDRLLAENKTTGTNHSPDYVHYTRMNVQRAHRIEKTIRLNSELSEALQSWEGNYTWLVLVEAWCGDVPQNLPVIAMMAEQSPAITLKLVLRDEHPELMEHFLTEGGKSIPKLIHLDTASLEVLGSWGPRPEPAQQMVRDYKAAEDRPPYMKFVEKVQLWYANDKTQTLQKEFLHLLQDWKHLQPA